jgi:hypothetical protein
MDKSLWRRNQTSIDAEKSGEASAFSWWTTLIVLAYHHGCTFIRYLCRCVFLKLPPAYGDTWVMSRLFCWCAIRLSCWEIICMCVGSVVSCFGSTSLVPCIHFRPVFSSLSNSIIFSLQLNRALFQKKKKALQRRCFERVEKYAYRLYPN